MKEETLILASGSQIRTELLRNAGVAHLVKPARIDEASIKASMLGAGGSPRDIADCLAEQKAKKVAMQHPSAVVLGSDQVLELDGKIYDKASDLDELKRHLKALRGKTHSLYSAAVIFEQNRPVWRKIAQVKLTMRDFSDEFLENYVAQYSSGLLATVGGYKIEEGGVALFTRIEGDYFSVLGMPLLEVLAFLRTRGLAPT